MPHLPDARRIKINHSYTIAEAAEVLGLHPNTVLNWTKKGLPVCDEHRPFLIHGRSLREFIRAKRAKAKRPCAIGKLYCFRCRVPKAAAGRMLDYEPKSHRAGNLVALCIDCGTVMYRAARLDDVYRDWGGYDITFKGLSDT